MVKIHLKRGEESLFLYETVTSMVISELKSDLLEIYNLKLKIQSLCDEVEDLANYGVTLALNIRGLDDEVLIEELKLSDETLNQPEGGYIIVKDPLQKRCGKAPVENMKEVLLKCVEEAKIKISKQQIEKNLTKDYLEDILDSFKMATSLVYPAGLPAHDPIYQEFEEVSNKSDSLCLENCQLWWASKELDPEKRLSDYIGKNEKTKIIAKIQKKGEGLPPREASISQEEKMKLMSHYYKRQEELKQLADDDEDSYLDSNWANNQQLKRSFLGLKDVQFKPK